ncbi:WLM domain-containing protein [Jimgerdemannia flammicorona]|uniref:WLM domain-containing protein n=1 Tax=Jimgerdemannia flammicorona TaxID=994334 RepID=A0A433DAW2_9FUNG|nr:WLM domain-containing protein [Jimgerdemannia flammicorona]
MTDLIGEFNVLKKMDRQDEATALLRKIASQVKPIMKKRGWKVTILQEFFPTNPTLLGMCTPSQTLTLRHADLLPSNDHSISLGLNVNHGYKICIRLRPHYDSKMFLPYESLLGTMLHE